MKKLVHLLLATSLMFTLCACGGDTATKTPDSQGETPEQDAASESQWPTSAVNLVVPASAGGGTDSNARVVAKYLTEELGVPVKLVGLGVGIGDLQPFDAKEYVNAII